MIEYCKDLENGDDANVSATLDCVTLINLATRRGTLNRRHASTAMIGFTIGAENVEQLCDVLEIR
jgi:hypothetical protein